MSIPDYQTIHLPLLRQLVDGDEHRVRDLYERIAREFDLTDDDLRVKLPSGQQAVFQNRVGWAKTHLKAAGLLDNPVRGRIRITDAGRDLLAKSPTKITLSMLKEYPAFSAFWEPSTDSDDPDSSADKVPRTDSEKTPLETLNASFRALQDATKAELLARLKTSAPAFFEKAVVSLLVAMGYGGVGGTATITGQPGDGGIDGTISEDKLGLDVICIQAKRYDTSSVGRPAVQAFVGSMDLHRSKKGVILTTSEFTKDSRDFIHCIEGKKVVLIDGNMLADLMVTHGIGVSTTNTYELKEVSNDFFDEDDG